VSKITLGKYRRPNWLNLVVRLDALSSITLSLPEANSGLLSLGLTRLSPNIKIIKTSPLQ
jgi:hypothetical protein